jgi:oligopeptide transport system ATP-binding protein
MTTAVKNEKVLEVKNLRTYFYTQEGELKANDNLNYYVNKGESVAVVGESACGKSVSALSIMRLIPYPPGIIVGGEVIFQGQDLLQATEAEMRHIRGNRIAMVFQEAITSLNPLLTVKRQISESLELHRNMNKNESLQETIRLLKLVGIPDSEKRANDYPFQFSGGMQQRIMIAMALSCNPSLLICDEPTTALDVTVQAQLLEIIDGLRSQFGTSVITITHNLGIVARYVDRVNVMYAGRIIETAPTEELYANPCHPYTIGLLASVPRLDVAKRKSLRMIKGLPPNLARLPGGCPFHPRCEWVMPRCRVEYPATEKVGDNHYRNCFAELSKLKKQ